jgi:hypothetical protein
LLFYVFYAVMNLDLDIIHSAAGSRVSSRVNTPPIAAFSPVDKDHLAQGSSSTYKHLTVEQQATLSSLMTPNPHGLRHPRRAMLRRNESLARMNSTSNTAGGNNDKGKMEKTRSRRMAQINPDVKIIDITRPTRGIGEKKKVANRGEIFKFDCEGDIVAHSNVGTSAVNNNGDVKRHVKWHATFDRPIEQLIYPSLQRFDNEAYEEKRKVYKQLHGNHELSVGVATTLTNTAGSASIKPSITSPGLVKSPKSSTQASATSSATVQPSLPHQYSYQENHGIKLDLLPEAANFPSDFMFIHTPKWTVEVSEVKPSSPSDANGGRSPLLNKERKKSTPKGNRRKTLLTAGSTASSDGKKSARIKTASSTKSRRKSNFGPLGISQDLEDDSYDNEEKEDDDEDDNYSLSSHEFESDRMLEEIKNKQKKHRSAIEEIEDEGERYLRQKIRDHYKARVNEEKEAEDELQHSLSPFHDLKKSLYKKEITLPPILQTPTDNLVSFVFCLSFSCLLLSFPLSSFLFFSLCRFCSMLNWLIVIMLRKQVEFRHQTIQ